MGYLGTSLVIRPPQSLRIGHTEKNPDELERVYQIGIREAEKRFEEIQNHKCRQLCRFSDHPIAEECSPNSGTVSGCHCSAVSISSVSSGSAEFLVSL